MPKGIYRHKPLTESHKSKLAEKLKGRPVSIETRQKIGWANKGRILSEVAKQKIKAARAKQIITKETGDKISKARMGHLTSEETRKKIALANSKPMVWKSCLSCKRRFSMWPSKANSKKYCSRICQFESQKGKSTWNKGLKG